MSRVEYCQYVSLTTQEIRSLGREGWKLGAIYDGPSGKEFTFWREVPSPRPTGSSVSTLVRSARGNRPKAEIARAWAAFTGKAVGGCRNQIERIESGARFQVDTLLELAVALDVEPQSLLPKKRELTS